MKELNFNDLSFEQKLGMVTTGIVRPTGVEDKYGTFEENLEYILELIKNHALGAVWVHAQSFNICPDVMDRIKAAADYPLIIFGDAENGLGDHLIGRHNSLGMADREDLAYTFGKVTGITARKLGYNAICDPVLDVAKSWAACGGNSRALGSDKYRVAELAVAEAQGIHDGGILTIAKHYPSPGASLIDNHMAPIEYNIPKEVLIEENLYPYTELMKRGLLDGIMVGHRKITNIDPDYPSSLSKKIIGIIRELGFDGFFITDSLSMTGLRAEYGDSNIKDLCIEAGNEFSLPWFSTKKAIRELKECFDKGLVTEKRLDEAVKKVLETQHKVLMMEPKYTEITKEDVELFDLINRDGIYLKADEGVEKALDPDGKHLFVVLAKNETEVSTEGKVTVDTFTNDWWKPVRITKKLEELYPNSAVRVINQFPSGFQNTRVIQESTEYSDLVFVTFTEAPANVGSDHLTHRVVALINAFYLQKRPLTLVHFGNAYPLEELPHIPRVIIGGISTDSVDAGLDVLAGKYPAKGKLTYDVKLK